MEQLAAILYSDVFFYSWIAGIIALVISSKIYFRRQAQKRDKLLTRILELEKQKTKRMEMEMEKQS